MELGLVVVDCLQALHYYGQKIYSWNWWVSLATTLIPKLNWTRAVHGFGLREYIECRSRIRDSARGILFVAYTWNHVSLSSLEVTLMKFLAIVRKLEGAYEFHDIWAFSTRRPRSVGSLRWDMIVFRGLGLMGGFIRIQLDVVWTEFVQTLRHSRFSPRLMSCTLINQFRPYTDFIELRMSLIGWWLSAWQAFHFRCHMASKARLRGHHWKGVRGYMSG